LVPKLTHICIIGLKFKCNWKLSGEVVDRGAKPSEKSRFTIESNEGFFGYRIGVLAAGLFHHVVLNERLDYMVFGLMLRPGRERWSRFVSNS